MIVTRTTTTPTAIPPIAPPDNAADAWVGVDLVLVGGWLEAVVFDTVVEAQCVKVLLLYCNIFFWIVSRVKALCKG